MQQYNFLSGIDIKHSQKVMADHLHPLHALQVRHSLPDMKTRRDCIIL